MRHNSFAPLLGPAPRLLILGSLPGAASLAAHQYYAHPRNLFWDFMQALFGVPRDLPYDARCQALTARGVALWDVVQEAERAGSLDAAIDLAGARHNAVAALVAATPTLEAIAFNGATAARLYARHVAPELAARAAPLALVALPSTSPANAQYTPAFRREAWRVLTRYASGP